MALTLGTYFGRYEIVSFVQTQRKSERQAIFETRNLREGLGKFNRLFREHKV